MKKDKLFLALYVVFAILTFASAIHVVLMKSNAGFSIVTMLFSMFFSNLYNQEKRK